MKRFFALALILSIIMTLCGCKDRSAEPAAAPFDSSDVSELDGIAQRDIHSIRWQTVGFTHAKSDNEINIAVPTDWSFEGTGKKYNILRGGKVIGTVTSKPSDTPQKEFDVKNGSSANLKYDRAIHKNGDRFTYAVSFTYTADTTTHVTLEVDYAELCNAAVTRMVNDTLLHSVSKTISGDFTLDPQNTSKQFLVCGNSFIGSSQIIQWFNQMCRASGNGYSMSSGTAGMIATEGSYANEDVKNGKYAAIFLCGFYSENQIKVLERLKPLCEQSNTLLVVFPAHNEVPALVDKALSANTDIPCIDWQAEIQALIDLGVDYWDMCLNDAHLHTTHLGGYVGAHMIYRTMFDEIPPKVPGTGDCSMSEVKQKLGDYVTTGQPKDVDHLSANETIVLK